MYSDPPVVTAIMPTRGRPLFAAGAVQMFLAQTWPNKQLVIVDDLDARSFDSPPEGANVHYRLLEKRLTIGEKRNVAVAVGGGDILIHFDDDDIYSPDYIEHQVNHLLDSGLDVVGYNEIDFLNEETGERWNYRNPRPIGATLCYWRRVWQEHPFSAKQVQEEYDFMERRRLSAVKGEGRVTARIHLGNTSIKDPMSNAAQWKKVA